MRILEEPYFSPDGTVDFPFSYVYDTSAFADGVNVLNIAQQLQGDSDFILRRIMGVPLCVATPANNGKFNYQNPSGAYANGNLTSGIIMPNTWPVVPEKHYRVNDQISFDLYNTLRSNVVCSEGTIYNSQIAFSGVKRYGNGSTYPRQYTAYKYREKTYKYIYQLTINWGHFQSAGVVAPARRFLQQMDNLDFELLGVRISQPGSTHGLLTDDFQITLFDANSHQYSNKPINQSFINMARQSPAVCSPYQACFPTPSQIYPKGSAIQFDITSLLCSASLPQSYEIQFDGIWRYPCQTA